MTRHPSLSPALPRCLLILVLLTMGLQASAAEFTVGNLLVTFEDNLYEFTPAGSQVQLLAIDGVTEEARELVLERRGLLGIYNGTFSPKLSLLEPASVMWADTTLAGWSTVNNVSYGGLAAYRHYMFATDMTTADPGGPRGLVRFDINTGGAQRFADAEYIDTTLGLDGRLYALVDDEETVHVFDPETLASEGTISLAIDVRGIAVNAAGDIFGASWDGNLYAYSGAGALTDFHDTGIDNLTDIDINLDGELVAGSRFGEVILSTEALDSSTNFDLTAAPGGGQQTFVTFVTDPRIFGDGFEGGDPTQWSRVVSDGAEI
jgi:hypothetical protein